MKALSAWKFFALALGLAASAVIAPAAAQDAAPKKVVIADQFGPGHLVTVVMKRRNLLEKRFPGTEFDWRVVTSGAVMRKLSDLRISGTADGDAGVKLTAHSLAAPMIRDGRRCETPWQTQSASGPSKVPSLHFRIQATTAS